MALRRVIRANYEQLYLLPPSINDWIPADHPARFIRDFVDALDLADLGFKLPQAVEGRPPYACDLLLKVWLHGYFHKIRSSRGLEKACHDSIALVWLTGNEHPDHNTLWRFWRNNREALKGVFQSSIRVAVRNDLVSLALQAVDGSKIPAQASTARAWHRERLEKHLAKLDEAIARVMEQVEEGESEETASYRLPPEMADAEKRREQIRRGLEELRQAGRKHLHPAEPEARMMRCREGKKLGYNAQAVTEESNNIIVSAAVTDEANDYHQLTPMMAAAEENVGAPAEVTVADSGYYSGEQLAQAEQLGKEALTNIPRRLRARQKQFSKSRFTYDPEGDIFRCPQGSALEFEHERKWRRQRVRVYRCRNDACGFRGQCTRDVRGRAIEKEQYYDAVQRHKQKQQLPEKQAQLKKRGQIAELTFARLKQLLEFRRWTLRGLENVRTQWSLLCATLNLRVLFKYWKQGRLQMS